MAHPDGRELGRSLDADPSNVKKDGAKDAPRGYEAFIPYPVLSLFGWGIVLRPAARVGF
jgi:hypothetical protein